MRIFKKIVNFFKNMFKKNYLFGKKEKVLYLNSGRYDNEVPRQRGSKHKKVKTQINIGDGLGIDTKMKY